jgi:hypothetical protein
VETSRLFLGNTASQKWIGGEVTGGVDMGGGSAASESRVPTQRGVYEYTRNSFVGSVNGATGAVTDVARTVVENTFTAVQSFSAGISAGGGITFGGTVNAVNGISAAGGITFNGSLSGTTAAFSRLVTFAQGISAAGATFTAPISGTTAAFTGNVGIGAGATAAYRLYVDGAFAATTKSFVIPHPTETGKSLRYGSLEGPENGVYVRGRSDSNVVFLPPYWRGLVDESSITVNITPVGGDQRLWVAAVDTEKVIVYGSDTPHFFYTVWGERKDVPRLEVEF